MSEIMINVETEQLNSNYTPKVKLIKSILEDIKNIIKIYPCTRNPL